MNRQNIILESEGKPETDALMICLPGTAETKGFVNLERVCEIFCEDLENYFNGRPLNHAVELSVGY